MDTLAFDYIREKNVKRAIFTGAFFKRVKKRSSARFNFLVNGIKLQGQIESFDQFVIVLRDSVNQMIYKSAISTVVPARPVKIVGEDNE